MVYDRRTYFLYTNLYDEVQALVVHHNYQRGNLYKTRLLSFEYSATEIQLRPRTTLRKYQQRNPSHSG